MSYDPGVIIDPLFAHGARTEDEYRAWQERLLAKQRRLGLSVASHAAPDGAIVLVSGGSWKVVCGCGNAPVASPAWDLALCPDCGACYRRLTWPDERDAIAQVLLARPLVNRHWQPHETVADLEADNVAHGVPARRGE